MFSGGLRRVFLGRVRGKLGGAFGGFGCEGFGKGFEGGVLVLFFFWGGSGGGFWWCLHTRTKWTQREKARE